MNISGKASPVEISFPSTGLQAPIQLYEHCPIRIDGNWKAAALSRFVRFAAHLTYPVRHRGIGRLLDTLSNIHSFESALCTVHVGSDAVFSCNASDSYWGFWLYTGVRYEYPMHLLFAALFDIDFDVLDCGANFGYWSVLLSSSAYGHRRVVAVEPSAQTFQRLEFNCAQNGHRFRTVHRAITGRTGENLLFQSRRHAVAHVYNGGLETQTESLEHVESICLDDLCDQSGPKSRKLLVKLDVEGYETEVLRTSKCIRERDALIIYEDNQSDAESTTSAYMLAQRQFVIYWINDDGGAVQITDVAEVRRIKNQPRRGCNLFVGSGFNFLAATRDGEFDRCLQQRMSAGASSSS